jgi:RING-H2 zinc finger domain
MNRIHTIGIGSIVVSLGIVSKAFITTKGHFYATCINITQHNTNLLVLLSMMFYYAILFGKLIQKIWFGPLRALEVEHLYERSWFAVMDTCLALTMFRDGFDFLFILRFGTLLFAKTFHWIIADRIDFMEQSLESSWKFHLKMTSIMLSFFLLDIVMLMATINHTLDNGPSMLIIFGFEYALLASSLFGMFIKYCLQTIELGLPTPWEEKTTYFSYVDLAQDFFKLVSYSGLVAVLVHYYGLPLHIIRDVYMTLRRFVERVKKLIRSRQAIANMETRYPTATAADLNETDRVCIVCREDMVAPILNGPNETLRSELPKKLPCGHIFHFRCLRSWLDRQQACPTWYFKFNFSRREVLLDDINPTTNPPAADNNPNNLADLNAGGQPQFEPVRNLNELLQQLQNRNNQAQVCSFF